MDIFYPHLKEHTNYSSWNRIIFMIVTSFLAWLEMLSIIILASLAGWAFGRILPFSIAARLAGVSGAVGVALGPFMLGAGSVLVLTFFPARSHAIHLTLVYFWLTAIVILGFWIRPIFSLHKNGKVNRVFGEYLLYALLALWVVMLFINSIFLPLLQNDALEYATVGKLLYESRDLASYPAINPEQSMSGFFAPWTHPPLYVSLIYIMQIIQGYADEPGFMRLIAPWFAFCTTLIILSVGSMISRMTGLLSAIIFLSTPLLFAGADSSLIDALPVLGITLIVAIILGLESGPFARGAAIGGALGLALWTHSQAVLFLPMALMVIVLQNGLRYFSITIKESISMIGVAFLFGFWPYWRNLKIFGSAVSDNPVVFAIPSLDWAGYFSFGRGLDNWAAVLQYGLLKGWFSFEAYGWAFWLMTLGIVIGIKSLRKPTLRAIMVEGGYRVLDPSRQVLWVSLIIIFTYLGGVLISVMVGMDLMIKNERYMLVILPFVALLAGYGAQIILLRSAIFISVNSNSTLKRDILSLAAIILTFILIIQLIVTGIYYRWRHAPSPIKITLADDLNSVNVKQRELEKTRFQRLLEVFPNVSLMYWVRANLSSSALLFSLRPADMYYSQRKMISYLDERLLTFYSEISPARAANMLSELGVTHLHVPDYGLPVSYNSVVDRIIEDPALTRLLHSDGGSQIYQLLSPRENSSGIAKSEIVDFSPSLTEWTRYLQFNFGGRKALNALGISGNIFPGDGVSTTMLDLPFFHRDFSTIVANGLGDPLGNVRLDSTLPIKGSHEYRVIFELEGRAFIRVWMVQFNSRGSVIKQTKVSGGPERISELVLTESAGVKRISRRFLSHPDAAYVRFGIEHVGHSNITIKKAVLESFLNNLREGS